jgi:hypothetical protein
MQNAPVASSLSDMKKEYILARDMLDSASSVPTVHSASTDSILLRMSDAPLMQFLGWNRTGRGFPS